ncbi:MAG: S1C family serine protease [Bacteroidota bacterium]
MSWRRFATKGWVWLVGFTIVASISFLIGYSFSDSPLFKFDVAKAVQAGFSSAPVMEDTSDIIASREAEEIAQSKPASQTNQQQLHTSRQTAITNAVKEVSGAVVSITVTEVISQGKRLRFDPFYGFFMEPGRERQFESMGSGFIISEDGKVVTNEHVCGTDARKVMITINEGDTTKNYPAEVIGADEFSDIALLQIQADRTFPYVTFGDSKDVMVGEWSIAIGNPFGLFEDGKSTVTVGVVSAISRDFRPDPDEPRVYLDMIQTDAAINRGNSGGPLVNSAGNVIGVNTFIYTGGTSSGFVGLGFAIPSHRVKQIISQLDSSGKVSLDFDPGFDFASITRNIAYRYQLPTTQGLLITSVNRNGPAYEAGILPGDIILSIEDTRIHSKTHALALFREYHHGDKIKIELLRNGQRYQATMVLRRKKGE